jgi:glycosyltransferase involved in cell wall biosynthesis
LNSALRRILIFIPEDYAAGGIQRSAVALHDCLLARGYSPTIHCTRLMPGGFAETHTFISAVAPVSRSKLLTWANYFRGMRKLLRQERPVAAIGLGLVPSAALPVATAGLDEIVTIGSERAHPPEVPVGRIFSALRRIMFPRLDYVVCQTSQIAQWFGQTLGIPKERLVVIPNVVRPAPDGWIPASFANSSERLFVAVGRLDRQKGFDLALRAFAQIVAKRPGARLLIVGEGPLQEELLALRAQLGLINHVEFRAPQPELKSVWREAYALFLTSRYEGFPNVLAEAMAHGVPAVAFDCPSGPSEIINDGVDGFLVGMGDVNMAADRCIELIEQPAMRDRFAREAMEVSVRYSFDRMADLWTELLSQATERCAG